MDREKYKASLIELKGEIVEEMPACNWREDNKSSSSNSEEDTESEIGPSQKKTNYLETSGEVT